MVSMLPPISPCPLSTEPINMLTRLLYLGYHLKNLDTKKLRLFTNHVTNQQDRSSVALLADMVGSSLKYNTSLLEYFQFHFYEKDARERATYAGTGYMYEYQLLMNPKSSRAVLDDKKEFFVRYSPFVKHLAADIDTLRAQDEVCRKILANPSGKIVLKYSHGQCGWQVGIYKTDFFRNRDLVEFMEEKNYDLAEEFIVQHPDLMSLSPSGVNTVRVITQLDADDEVVLLGARLRVSENSPVDNMASGNFAAAIDIKPGIVNTPGVYSDITKDDVTVHPVTGVDIVGFQVPYWPEIISMVKKAAVHAPENRSIGWDVAVTENGPGLIEGNHDWCKLVWQLPIKQGLKPVLKNHWDSYSQRPTRAI